MDYPGASYWVASPNSFDRPGAITSIIIHTTQGPAMDESASVNKFLGTNASIHYIVNRTGVITQMVRDARVAFHVGGRWNSRHNLNSIGIEHVNPRGMQVPSEIYVSSARLVSWLCLEYNIPRVLQTDAAIAGIKSHQTVSSRRKPCPGDDWNWDRYLELVEFNVPSHDAFWT